MTAQEYMSLPQSVKDILSTFNTDADGYAECARIEKELELIGWACEYGLDAELFNITKK
jgi:hypothetical protein